MNEAPITAEARVISALLRMSDEQRCDWIEFSRLTHHQQELRRAGSPPVDRLDPGLASS